LLFAAADHAFSMLRSLSGRTHQVVTAVTMLFHADEAATTAVATSADGAGPASTASAATTAAPLEVSFSVQTDVTFAELDDAVIRMYVDSNEPMSVHQRHAADSIRNTRTRAQQRRQRRW